MTPVLERIDYYPFSAPGMPKPGPNFTRLAGQMADGGEGDGPAEGDVEWWLERLYRGALYEQG